MNPRKLLLLFVLMAAIAAQGQDTGGELAKIKEQELEEVRERISTLKKSMDESAAARVRNPPRPTPKQSVVAAFWHPDFASFSLS